MPTIRAIRGATTVDRDDPIAVRAAVRELLETIQSENHLRGEEVISALFTLTPDLQSAFPASTARAMGWTTVPLLCASEIAVPGSLPRCLRVLLHVERCKAAAPVRHVYLREAVVLRPDLSGQAPETGLSEAWVCPTPT